MSSPRSTEGNIMLLIEEVGLSRLVPSKQQVLSESLTGICRIQIHRLEAIVLFQY